MKKRILLLLLVTYNIAIAQKKKSAKMGQTTLEELRMTVYDKDSTAAAVVLYEHANRYPDINNNEIPRTDYYYRIKILDKSSFDLADITIPLYQEQRIADISATTYNLTKNGSLIKENLLEENIFTVEENENWTTKKFTLPNIKEGSVIEYKYSILSPYLQIKDWYFQSDIPKIKSEFDASILGNYQYNIKISGYLKLEKHEASVDKKCVYINGIGDGACVIYSYAMYNIPAFKEEEYMLSKENYISKLSFTLKSTTSYKGVVKKLTTNWKEADKSLKKYFFNNQTSKVSFFKKNIPKNILNTDNTLAKSKKIFSYIQNHFTWNEKYWTNEDAKVKEAFQEKKGGVGEINISLYNSLKAANIEADLVVLSTRNNGLTTKLFPIIYDYNYVIVKTTIDGISYFLDATDKFLPFGQVPVRTLNGEARIINFKKKSSWTVLKPKIKTVKNISAELTLNEEGIFSGNLMINHLGYFASSKRKSISSYTKESYLENFESKNANLEVEDYEHKNLSDLDKPLQELFSIKIEMNEELGNKTRINPIFFERIKRNPFKLKERHYPVDYAYPSRIKYSLNLNLPENYIVTQIPKDVAFSLPNNGGSFILKTIKKENSITVYTMLNINKKIYNANEYLTLKEFYKQLIIAENRYIVLEKK